MRSRIHVPAHERPRQSRSRLPHGPGRTIAVAVATAAAFGIGIAGLAGGTGSASAAPAVPASRVLPAGGFTDTWGLKDAAAQAAVTRAASVIAAAAPARVTVSAGQTLSTISAAQCGSPRFWTGIYAASRQAHLTARDANRLTAGQQLAIECYENPGMAGRAYTPPPPPPAVVTAATVTASPQPAPQQHAASASGTYHGSGSMESCIIARESGGDSQVMNDSGHYGLYQFSESTWVGSGGSAADFGHASVAEQKQVFRNAVAARGYSDWTPYDGC